LNRRAPTIFAFWRMRIFQFVRQRLNGVKPTNFNRCAASDGFNLHHHWNVNSGGANEREHTFRLAKELPQRRRLAKTSR
jgi:hypothetical protein